MIKDEKELNVKHVFKLIYSNKRVLLSLVTIFLFAIAGSLFISWQSSMRLEQLAFYNQTQNIYETSQAINLNSFYKIDGLCTVHLNFHGEFEKCDCSVKTNKLMLQEKNYKLNQNEASISSNLARKNNLAIGDFIYLSSLSFNTFEKYEIKDITDACYGFKDIDYSNPSGIVIFGYDERIALASQKFISFISDSEKNNNTLPPNSIIYSVNKLKNNIVASLVLSFGICFFGVISIVTAFFLLTFGDFIVIEKNKKKYGEDNKTIIKETFAVTSPLLFLPLLILLIVLLSYIAAKNIYYLSTSLYLFLLIFIGILISQLVFEIKVRKI